MPRPDNIEVEGNMTYIEFFDKEPMENICSCMARRPDRVIFVGQNKSRMQKCLSRYRRIFADRGISIWFEMVAVKKDCLEDIVEKLCGIVEENLDADESFVFDLTGGDDMCLVAMGILFEKFRGCGLQMHRFNLRNNRITDCDADGNVLEETEASAISIEENLRAFGGDIIYESQQRQGTVEWELNEEFLRDVDYLWAALANVGRYASFSAWNRQCDIFAAIDAYGTVEGLTSSVSADALDEALVYDGKNPHRTVDRMIRKLSNYQLIAYTEEDGRITVTYKNPQIKRCLTKAGQTLETVVYAYALQARDRGGVPVYNDVMTGVYIDWDGDPATEQDKVDTTNEIDVLMMHGFVPVFVSCKNGNIKEREIDELYKLETVANRFGGKYAKKVLVTTMLKSSTRAAYFRQRARDMGITLLEPADLDKDAFIEAVGALWSSAAPVPIQP